MLSDAVGEMPTTQHKRVSACCLPLAFRGAPAPTDLRSLVQGTACLGQLGQAHTANGSVIIEFTAKETSKYAIGLIP